MRLIRVVIRQCETLKSLQADEYLGTRIGYCPYKIEHIVVSRRKIHVFSKECESCVLAKLIRNTHVIGLPVIKEDQTIHFIVRESRNTLRVLREHAEDIVEIEPVDYREVYLTIRQKEALRLLANGDASNISRLARKLGISKPAALKLVKKSIQKIANRYS